MFYKAAGGSTLPHRTIESLFLHTIDLSDPIVALGRAILIGKKAHPPVRYLQGERP